MKLSKLISDLKLKTVGRIRAAKCGKTDLGIVKVAFMVAALDGEVSEAEYKALDALLKKCRGYSKEAAALAFDEAMRSAGYLMLLSRRAKDSALVAAFVREAQAALPNGFAYLSIDEVRRAMATWIAMGMSDGDYSAREKKCIEALRKLFAELKVMRIQAEEEQWLQMAPAFRQACAPGARNRTVELVSQDFVKRVERLVAQYGDSAEASKKLGELIAG